MKKLLFLVIVLCSINTALAQNGMFMPSTYDDSFSMYLDTGIDKSKTPLFSPGPYVWLFPLSVQTLYFWYSQEQSDSLQKAQRKEKVSVKSWYINGKKFTEITKPRERPKDKNAELVYIWKDGKNDLVITEK